LSFEVFRLVFLFGLREAVNEVDLVVKYIIHYRSQFFVDQVINCFDLVRNLAFINVELAETFVNYVFFNLLGEAREFVFD